MSRSLYHDLKHHLNCALVYVYVSGAVVTHEEMETAMGKVTITTMVSTEDVRVDDTRREVMSDLGTGSPAPSLSASSSTFAFKSASRRPNPLASAAASFNPFAGSGPSTAV